MKNIEEGISEFLKKAKEGNSLYKKYKKTEHMITNSIENIENNINSVKRLWEKLSTPSEYTEISTDDIIEFLEKIEQESKNIKEKIKNIKNKL